jgi:hypothetical protein
MVLVIELRPLLRAILAWALVTAALSFALPQVAFADNGEPVSKTPHANTSEIAMSPDGSRLYLVWYDYQTAGGESGGGVYFRYRDAGGWHPSLDQGPVSLSDPNGRSQAPAIAVDTNGGIHVVWAEGSPRIIYHRQLPPGADPANAGAWSGAEVASNENDAQTPSLVADNAGGIWMVYTVFADPNYDIFARHRGSGWEGSTNISRSGGRGAFLPRAGVDKGGAVSVVWWERPGVIRYVSNAKGWGEPETATGPATQQVGIAVEPNGRIYLIYTESVGDNDNDRRISYRTREYWGAPWSNTEVLSDTGNMLEPRIAWANGRLVATWSDRTGGEKQIYVMQNFGSGWRDRQAWTSGFNAFSPRIVEDPNRVAYVAFRNVSTDQIQVSTYTAGTVVTPSPAPTPAPPANNPAQPATAILDGTHSYFAETSHNLGGAFRAYWQANGGLTRFGLPLTEEFTETSPDDGKTYTVQYFERARFEYHPENAPPYDVLLVRLGLRLRPLDPPADPLAGASYFTQTGHNLSGTFLQYWLANGGLAVYGYPTSEAFTETSPTDGKPYLVQYFERNRFEYHPENAGTPYEVLLGLLGRQELVDRGWLPK